MISDVIEMVKKYPGSELYILEGDDIPFFAIITDDTKNVINELNDIEELEADVAVLSPDEVEDVASGSNEFASEIRKVLQEGKKLV
ncbi:MAG: hypothetical protein R6U52_00290 [Kosmotogaceae bacterium]